MTKENKLKYEPPVVLPLGELAKGHGAPCSPVGSAPTGQCKAGAQIPPQLHCTNGGQAGLGCSNGARFGK
jgi:hypothetical protein